MILNFFYFAFFLIIFFSIGHTFNLFYLGKNFFLKKNYDLFNTNNFTSSLFFFGITTIFLNFFISLNNYFIKLFFFLIIIYSLNNSKNFIFNSIKKNYLIIILISLICFYMNAGYDGGLYHLPHQSIIRENKIIFGLFNLHERFGAISIYGYISSILWIKNNLIILSFLQGSFYFSLFYIIKENLLHNNIIQKSFGFSTLLFVPIWIRYAEPSFSLVDIPAAIIFYIAFLKGVEILYINLKDKINLKIFLLLSALIFTFKISGSIFLIFVLFIFFKILKSKSIKIKDLLLFNLLPLILIIFWLIKSYINTGCFIFPIPQLCVETSWSNIQLTNSILSEIKIYGKKFISFISIKDLLDFINLYYIFIFSILVLFIFSFFNKIILIKLISLTLIICNLYVIYSLEFLSGFSTLLNSNVSSDINNGKIIFVREIVYIFLILFSLFFFNIIFFIKKKIKIKKIIFFPLFCNIVFLFFWLYSSPNPRFVMGYFSIIPISISILFIKYFSKKLFFKQTYLISYFYIFLLLNINLLIKDKFVFDQTFTFPSKFVKKTETEKRKNFGVKPKKYCDDPFRNNFCRIEKNCYFIENDGIRTELKYGYFQIEKILDRKLPNCVNR